MIVENHIKDIDPRRDKDYVILMIQRLLDACDPDDVVDMVITNVVPRGGKR